MKKYFIKFSCVILFLVFTLIPSLYAKDLTFQADANLNTIRWTTFVKAHNTSTSSDHTKERILRYREGGPDYYQTRFVTFHLSEGSYYNEAPENEKVDKLVYFDDSHYNVLSSSNYRNYDNLVSGGSTFLIKKDPANENEKAKEFYSTWSENKRLSDESKYAVEEQSHHDSNDPWMVISTFKIKEDETKHVQNIIDAKYRNNELETNVINGIIYARVRLTNVLSTNANTNMYNAYQFYYKSLGWDVLNEGHNKSGEYVKGKSALNNYDNILLIPFSEVPKNREVYVTHRELGTTGENGVFWGREEFLTDLEVDNIATNSKDIVTRKGVINANNDWWISHYTLTQDQRNLRLKKIDQLISEYGFKFRGVRVQSGTFDSGRISDNEDYNVNGVEVANEKEFSNEPIYVTFYYEKDKIRDDKDQYVYIKHVNQDTGTVITDLAGTETFSDGFSSVLNEKSNTLDYQKAYTFKANGSYNGGVYISNDFNENHKANINGVEYEYIGVKNAVASTYSAANSEINESMLQKDTGIWINASSTTKYNTIVFYYKKSGGITTDPDTTLTGRLAFWSEYHNSNKNVEYIPSSTSGTSNYLIPYIEGAKRYILPFVNESGTSIDDEKSYVKDYAEYRYVKIEKVKGSKKGTDGNTYYNEYETTGSTRNDQNQPISVNDSYTLKNKNFKFISSTNKDVTSNTLKFSSIELNSEQLEFNISGMEEGKVKSWIDYEYDHSVEHPAVPAGPDGTGGSSAYTTYYYKEITKCQKYNDDGTIGDEIISSGTTSNTTGIKPSKKELSDVTRLVPVSYKVTLKQKFRLSHLWVYLIENTNVKIEETGTQPRGKVYQNSDSFTITTTGSRASEETNNTYIGKVREQLKKYYTNYLDTKEKLPLTSKTQSLDFEGSCEKYKVLENAYNGLRFANADIKYKMYDLATNSYGTDEKTRSYNNNNYNIVNESWVKSSEVNENINIFTPISIAKSQVENEPGSYVNHSGSDQSGVIQKNAKFKFTPKSQNITYGSKEVTDEYVLKYIVKFDFDISEYKLYDSSGNIKHSLSKLDRNTKVTLAKGDYIEGIASNGSANDYVGQFANKYKIFAIATNVINDDFVNYQLEKDLDENYSLISSSSYLYIDTAHNNRIDNENGTGMLKTPTSRNGNDVNKNNSGMTEDSHYIVERVDNTTNLNRIYDFKITDCTDVAYKDVFREIGSGNVNTKNTTMYYSGTKYWLLDSLNINDMLERTFSDSNLKTIIPLGPYKNTDTSYIFAPKLGYRFSFDLKTTGSITTIGNSITDNKKVIIKPSYYYIKKDGTEINYDIDLYYKKSSAQYVKFVGSGYTIQFRPNDGYRYISDQDVTSDLSYMSDKLNNLKISQLNGFELNRNMMAMSNNGFIQSWYGEFKLPNSTVVVSSGSSPNKENILTDGYIGVKFDIVAQDTVDGVISSISYNVNDKAAANNNNTSQWDYEGFLGFNQVGQELSSPIKIQLEKGIWNIDNNDKYNKIKGTVILYDIDNRAANDFN